MCEGPWKWTQINQGQLGGSFGVHFRGLKRPPKPKARPILGNILTFPDQPRRAGGSLAQEPKPTILIRFFYEIKAQGVKGLLKVYFNYQAFFSVSICVIFVIIYGAILANVSTIDHFWSSGVLSLAKPF